MAIDRRKLLLFAAAAGLRLLLFTAFPSLPDLLTGRVEISTPVTSFKRLQEGLYLYTHNVSPYDGGVFHQAPLLLPLFALLPSPFFTNLLYIALDILSANALMQIASSGEAQSTPLYTSPRHAFKYDSIYIGAAYLFNPLTLATCLGRPTSIFTTLSILTSISSATTAKPIKATLSLSLASYLSLYPILLLPPLLILSHSHLPSPKDSSPQKSLKSHILTHLPLFALSLLLLLTTSTTLLPSPKTAFLPSTYGTHLLLPDLTPNAGLWWYFFTEMFDPFREFFLAVFWLHLASYVPGLCFRLPRQPLFVLVTLLGVFAIFKPYPSIADTSLYLALLPLYRHIFPLMRYTFLSTCTLLYATLLGPAFYHLWIYAGSGNANFFYAITLVWSLGLSVIVSDSLFAVLRDEWEVERPEMKGKDVRQI
ncbi:hypothetical protein MMC12_001393 [Toensbergia leucococca]|nr:hypothetical protein [Toensbergia leucococca]